MDLTDTLISALAHKLQRFLSPVFSAAWELCQRLLIFNIAALFTDFDPCVWMCVHLNIPHVLSPSFSHLVLFFSIYCRLKYPYVRTHDLRPTVSCDRMKKYKGRENVRLRRFHFTSNVLPHSHINVMYGSRLKTHFTMATLLFGLRLKQLDRWN